MSTKPGAPRALAFALVLAALAPTRAGAEDPPKAKDDSHEKGVLTEDVDFSKPPHLVEAYNKARIKAKAIRDPRTQALTVEVTGKAYYPDGVQFLVDARYWKQKQPFYSTHATVKDKAFTVTLGPFDKAIPGGKLSIEAWFIAADQTPDSRDKLTKGNYFHCSPPCHYDRKNVTRDWVETGSPPEVAQQQDEAVEKKEIAKAREALLDASKVAGKVFDAVRTKEKTVKDAEAAFAQLDEDRKAALDAFAKWKLGRQFLLFPDAEGALERLAQWVKDTGRAQAAVAGVSVKGVDPNTAFSAYTRASGELSKVADELKSFLDEKDSLDKAWDDLGKGAKERNQQPGTSKAGGK